MSRYIPEYELLKKGSCGKPKIIDQATFEKFKKSGILRRFDWKQLPPPVEPPTLDLSGGSEIIKTDSEPVKKTTRKKK